MGKCGSACIPNSHVRRYQSRCYGARFLIEAQSEVQVGHHLLCERHYREMALKRHGDSTQFKILLHVLFTNVSFSDLAYQLPRSIAYGSLKHKDAKEMHCISP